MSGRGGGKEEGAGRREGGGGWRVGGEAGSEGAREGRRGQERAGGEGELEEKRRERGRREEREGEEREKRRERGREGGDTGRAEQHSSRRGGWSALYAASIGSAAKSGPGSTLSEHARESDVTRQSQKSRRQSGQVNTSARRFKLRAASDRARGLASGQVGDVVCPESEINLETLSRDQVDQHMVRCPHIPTAEKMT
eukprot:321684-Rhodomonas_salina.1